MGKFIATELEWWWPGAREGELFFNRDRVHTGVNEKALGIDSGDGYTAI